jgi:hypothetical protein
MPGGRATAEAILRLSDEMILQWLHRFDPQMPIWAMFVCPAMLSGLMVGKQAVNLKKIEESSTARVWAAPRDLEAQYVSFFICSNNYEPTREAYAMLESRAHNQMELALTTNGQQHQQHQQQQQSMSAPKATAAAIRIQKPACSSSSSSGGAKKIVLTPVSTPSSSISSCSDDDASSTDTEPSTEQPTRESTPPATHPTTKPAPSSSSSSSSSSLASTATTKDSDSDSSSSSSRSSSSSDGSPKVGALTRSLSGGTGENANHQSASPTKEKATEEEK